ncbi:MAG: hypothetical protein IKM20_07370 [Erysipelotrichales bacterium]|nr:hypothetical protein [Erysipelotrichales bacterium]
MYQPPFENNQILYFYDQPPYNFIGYNQPRHQQINYYRLLENTQKTLRTLNQIIPLVTHVVPLIHNASVMFKVSKAIKNIPDYNTDSVTNEPLYLENNISSTTTNPTFFS